MYKFFPWQGKNFDHLGGRLGEKPASPGFFAKL